MKGPNGKSVLLNRATVSISSTIYDRRALDCTDDKALVNSLNHLTFLTSSSVKVRDAMIQDGAIERLVGILYECRDPSNDTDSIMFAWKWVLSLQCLVLAGTRGSEKMRKKLVDAGIIPILATILDNHFLTKKSAMKSDMNRIETRSTNFESGLSSNNEGSNNSNNSGSHNGNGDNNSSNEHDNSNGNGNQSNNNNQTSNANHFTQSLEGSDVIINDDMNDNEISTVFREVRTVVDHADEAILDAQDEIEKFLKVNNDQHDSNHPSSLLYEEEIELLNVVELVKCFQKLGDCDLNEDISHLMNQNFKSVMTDPILSNELTQRLELSNILSTSANPFDFLVDNSKHLNPLSHTVPRSFENGLILPATDDVIWSLQLLAFISKYTYLRHSLSNTYLINGLSFRSRNNPPPLEVDSTSIDLDEFMTDLNDDPLLASSFDIQRPTEFGSTNLNFNLKLKQPLLISKQEERLLRLKNLSDEDDKGIVEDYLKIIQTDDHLEKIKYLEKIRLNSVRLKHESLGKLRTKNRLIYRNKLKEYAAKWDYDEAWNEFETPLDASELIDRDIQPFVTLNIFPLVERFTVKTWFQEDICYWAAVVVRNANRKDEKMGGRRQCANFNCGIWEDHPKQFSKCRRCKRAKYCSRNCQTKAWVFHKHWCVPAISPNSINNNASSASSENHNTHDHSLAQSQTHTPGNNAQGSSSAGTATTVPSGSSAGPRTIASTEFSVSVSGIPNTESGIGSTSNSGLGSGSGSGSRSAGGPIGSGRIEGTSQSFSESRDNLGGDSSDIQQFMNSQGNAANTNTNTNTNDNNNSTANNNNNNNHNNNSNNGVNYYGSSSSNYEDP